MAVVRMPMPRGLVSTRAVPGPGPAVGEDTVGVNPAGDGQTVLGFLVVDGVPAHHRNPGPDTRVRTASQDVMEDAEGQVAWRETRRCSGP